MKRITDFPEKVKHIENTFITMRDGCKLAARIWMPESADEQPVPAVLEYLPYRKRDGTRNRDDQVQTYFAGHGYAGVRVDMRGSGDSEGILEDEYLELEQRDCLDVLEWLEKQPWCTGDVGMIGISWGGFNGLQVAALRPPQLKTIITVCSTDDRYADDVHYMGGCLLGDNLSWASTMFAYNSCPPDPEIVGDKWRQMWLDRLEHSGLWLKKWLHHQHRDAYWKHGSICEDFSTVQIPVLAASGWADGYTNSVFRLVENLQGPVKGLVGPWSHKYPHEGKPGPAIGFLQECVKWWDKWLKGKDNDIMEGPALIAWMQDSVPPFTKYEYRPGRWVGEDTWPSDNVKYRDYKIAPHALTESGEPEVKPFPIQSPLTVGLFAGKWCSYHAGPDLPHDQRQEDGGALVFETEALDEQVEIFGAPVADLVLTSDKPVAMVACRLSDVAPDGKTTRITYGILNLTHRESHEKPEKLLPGQKYRVQVQLNDIAQIFPAGHKIRLSISSSYWPLAWPSPEPAMLNIYSGESEFKLPTRKRRDIDQKIHFDRPEAGPPTNKEVIEGEHHVWNVIRNLATDESVLEVVKDLGKFRIKDIDTEMGCSTYEWYRNQNDDYNSAQGETLWERSFKRGDWDAGTITKTRLSCDERFFYVHAQLDAYEGPNRVFSKDWNEKIPRRLV
ncbi:Cocaine esterase [Anaerohalosphaera lusitana]|uniref:Cocaine esterase n=1 Tax=Anaerohalosphaera lusitana TaxID=1936003 RepID=A0A1U9NJW9_9BACT|nr:CocE/NonD family hydrolase [Anaerohalosphaera lusitana]AQT68221.1 Cocaine esterase [Anaerohalosphaera lusitana]